VSQSVVDVTRVVRDEGTIVVMEGVREDGAHVQIALDHRMARPIAEALDRGEYPHCWVEPYQVLMVWRAPAL
jgi:hypothetical protein